MKGRYLFKQIGGVAITWPQGAGAEQGGKLAMRRREFLAVAGATAMTAVAGHASSMPVVGLLMATNLPGWANDGIRNGLADTGFEEGRNVSVIRRSADGQFEKLETLAVELANTKVDVILATASPVPARAAKAVTRDIPIVFAYGGDPVADGLVESLNHPGGNVTGATFIGTDLLAKRMELMHEILPHAGNVGLLVNPKGTLADLQIADATKAAQKLGQRLQIIKASTSGEIDTAFISLADLELDALIVSTDPLFGIVARDQLLRLTKELKLPAMFNASEPVRDGALIGYGPSRSDTWRQAAAYVGRILKGERPSQLPVVQPTKFEMALNLKTASYFGVALSPTLLARADEVVE
jgi:putative ABC transport system substrate-binding protein